MSDLGVSSIVITALDMEKKNPKLDCTFSRILKENKIQRRSTISLDSLSLSLHVPGETSLINKSDKNIQQVSVDAL